MDDLETFCFRHRRRCLRCHKEIVHNIIIANTLTNSSSPPPQTDCFLLCYSISSRTSFENIKSKWYPELRSFSKQVPIVLVGTKLDLRVPNSEKFVTTSEGKKLKRDIHAYSLVECSAMKKLNLADVFEEAIRAVERKKPPKNNSINCCIL